MSALRSTHKDKNMKTTSILYSLPLLLSLLACTAPSGPRSGGDGVEVSFKRPVNFLTEAPLKIELALHEPAKEDQVFTLKVSGNAEENVEYELSSKEVTIPKGSRDGYTTLRILENVLSDRQIRLDIEPKAGFVTGRHPTQFVYLEQRTNYITSFFGGDYLMTDQVEVLTEMYDGARRITTASHDYAIPYEIGKNSTAKEGIHFAIEGGKKSALMKTGESRGQIRLKLLKKEPGHDYIELVLKSAPGYFPGTNYSVGIPIVGPLTADQLVGDWSVKGPVNVKFLTGVTQTTLNEGKETHLPKSKKTDRITIRSEGGKLILDTKGLKGGLSHYLRDTELKLGSEEVPEPVLNEQTSSDLWGMTRTVNRATLRQANARFSQSKEELRPVTVSLRMAGDGKTLELQIYDYLPTDFFATAYETLLRKPSLASFPESGFPMKGAFSIIYHLTPLE